MIPDLHDPNTVYVNMLRGTIAKPSLRSIMELYPEITALIAAAKRMADSKWGTQFFQARHEYRKLMEVNDDQNS